MNSAAKTAKTATRTQAEIKRSVLNMCRQMREFDAWLATLETDPEDAR